jgi:hypothetical protein
MCIPQKLTTLYVSRPVNLTSYHDRRKIVKFANSCLQAERFMFKPVTGNSGIEIATLYLIRVSLL